MRLWYWHFSFYSNETEWILTTYSYVSEMYRLILILDIASFACLQLTSAPAVLTRTVKWVAFHLRGNKKKNRWKKKLQILTAIACEQVRIIPYLTTSDYNACLAHVMYNAFRHGIHWTLHLRVYIFLRVFLAQLSYLPLTNQSFRDRLEILHQASNDFTVFW